MKPIEKKCFLCPQNKFGKCLLRRIELPCMDIKSMFVFIYNKMLVYHLLVRVGTVRQDDKRCLVSWLTNRIFNLCSRYETKCLGTKVLSKNLRTMRSHM